VGREQPGGPDLAGGRAPADLGEVAVQPGQDHEAFAQVGVSREHRTQSCDDGGISRLAEVGLGIGIEGVGRTHAAGSGEWPCIQPASAL